MGLPQTDYQNKNNVLHGACMLEVSSDGISWVNCGALNEVKFTENLQVSKIETDNVSDDYAVTDQTSTIEAVQLELFDEDVRAIIRSSIDTVVDVAGVLVEDYLDVTASGDWAYSKFIPFGKENASGLAPTINSIAGGTDGPLVLNTDYFVMKDGTDWGYYVIDSATVTTEAQTMTVDMDYTPVASRTIHSGGMGTLPEFWVRLTNEDPNVGSGRLVKWTFYRCQLGKGYEIAYKKYNDEDDRDGNPIMFNALLDSDRTAGQQLYFITNDEPAA